MQERFVPEKATERQHLVCQANESNDQINLHAAAAAAAAVCLLVLEADTQLLYCNQVYFCYTWSLCTPLMHKLWLGFIQEANATASEVAGRVGEHTLLGARPLPSSMCASLGARPLPNDATHKKTKNYIVEEDDAPAPKRAARCASRI